MTIAYTNYKFSDLFEIISQEDESNPDSPFKFKYCAKKMNNKKEISGSGIYLIFDKHQEGAHRVIYIGMHNTNAPFHSERVHQHLASITFRQKVAFGAAKTANDLKDKSELQNFFRSKYGEYTENSVLYKRIFNKIEHYPWRVKGGRKPSFEKIAPYVHGSEVSRRRFEYACTFWDFFGVDNNINDKCFDNRFTFTWIDLNRELQELIHPDAYKNILQDIEKQLIWRFHPIVNEEMLNAGIRLEEDYSKLFSMGNKCGDIGRKVRSEIERIIKTYKILCLNKDKHIIG